MPLFSPMCLSSSGTAGAIQRDIVLAGRLAVTATGGTDVADPVTSLPHAAMRTAGIQTAARYFTWKLESMMATRRLRNGRNTKPEGTLKQAPRHAQYHSLLLVSPELLTREREG